MSGNNAAPRASDCIGTVNLWTLVGPDPGETVKPIERLERLGRDAFNKIKLWNRMARNETKYPDIYTRNYSLDNASALYLPRIILRHYIMELYYGNILQNYIPNAWDRMI